ncbi:polyprotein [Anopheles sinensis]|uniref:Polyprotein n=1 Tax=Anopheles sinensis TaxID=74873 RepID=A0A084VJX8_ANOSI|nr:polyprotein [Anopheles sinensis]
MVPVESTGAAISKMTAILKKAKVSKASMQDLRESLLKVVDIFKTEQESWRATREADQQRMREQFNSMNKRYVDSQNMLLDRMQLLETVASAGKTGAREEENRPTNPAILISAEAKEMVAKGLTDARNSAEFTAEIQQYVTAVRRARFSNAIIVELKDEADSAETVATALRRVVSKETTIRSLTPMEELVCKGIDVTKAEFVAKATPRPTDRRKGRQDDYFIRRIHEGLLQGANIAGGGSP